MRTTANLLLVVIALSVVLRTSLYVHAAPPKRDEASAEETPLSRTDRDHWAFRPLARPAPPKFAASETIANDIDRFISSRLRNTELRPLPEADRVTLIRRVSFGLTGLPPTPDQIDRFVNDESLDAYERLIDRLLGSPNYGVRWGQHWLDLARFAESDGFEHDVLRPNAWRYRDWVIDALNADMPYDEFVRLQLAGDELRPGDHDALIATGFALCGPDMPDINDQKERRHMVLNDMASTVGSVFLGLNVGCAQCHDHKFDPISQADFYRLRTFFENAQIFRDHPIAEPDVVGRWQKAKSKWDAERKRLRDDRSKLEKSSPRFKELSARLAKHQQIEPKIPHARVLLEATSNAPPSYLWVRGNFKRQGAKVLPGYPRIANPWNDEVAPPPHGKNTSGLRTQLAHWITRPDHPLALRVVANRIWQHHFGKGLVSTPSLFGVMGEAPTHPDLLDWLATELPRQGWSLKQMHKLILTSAVYRRASHTAVAGWPNELRSEAEAALEKARSADPDNGLLARQRRRRLDGEEIRDALLLASARLNFRHGGPGFIPPLPEEIHKTVKAQHWRVDSDESEHRRRSLYLLVRRNLRYPFFDVFDRPDTNFSCARRTRTTIAPQSLALLNSELSMEAARHLAGRALIAQSEQQDSTRASQVTSLYRYTLGRRPRDNELQLAVEFIDRQIAILKASGRQRADLELPQPLPAGTDPHVGAAFTALSLSLVNLNEFVYVD